MADDVGDSFGGNENRNGHWLDEPENDRAGGQRKVFFSAGLSSAAGD
jgi:hypothetical protein